MGDVRIVRDAADLRVLFGHLAEAEHEAIGFAFLDAQGAVLGTQECSAQHHDAVPVPLRTVAREALRLDAARVAMVHNHPSGDPRPSRDDLIATRRLATALAALDVRLVEHLVLTRAGGVFSLRGAGLL